VGTPSNNLHIRIFPVRYFQELTGTDVVMNLQLLDCVHPSLTDEMIDYILKTIDEFVKGHMK